MPILSKNAGAYANVVGVSHKAAGTYAAVQGIFMKSGGVYGSVLATAAPLTFGVTLSGVTGGLPASGDGIVTINQVAPVNAITPDIAVSRSTGVAPLAVTFDALGTTAPALTSLPFGEIYYAWTFGDPAGGATWAYGTRPGVNLKNEAIGPVAAHVFETHGSYTATCWAFYLDSGGTLHSGSSTTSITVTDPDTVFASNTIYISQSGVPVPGVDGVPPGANVAQVTSWSAIANQANTYKRILLKRGDVWVGDGTMSFNSAARAGQGIIGAYGTGAKPRVNMNADASAIRIDSAAPDWRFVDLDIVGDTVTYRANGDGITSYAHEVLVLRTDISLARILIGGGERTGYYIVDSVIGPTSTLGYGICGYTENSTNMAVLGSRYTGSGNHGNRVQGAVKSVFSNSTYDALTGNGHAFTIRGQVNTIDNAVWSGLWTEDVVVSDNFIGDIRGTHTSLRIHPQTNTYPERIRNILVERNHVSSYAIAASFSVATGLTVRNNLFVTRAASGWDIRGETTFPGSPFPTQGFFYNNTVYKPDIGLVNGFQVAEFIGTISGQVMTNNLAYAPLDTTPIFTNGATPAQYTASNNSTNTQMKNTRPWLAASPVAAVDFTPSGSYAVDGGTFVPVYKNYFGTTVSGTREIGAI
jgi:hypothetical protein